IFIERENLVAEDEVGRQPLDLRQLGFQAQFALILELEIRGEFFEVEKFQRVGQINLTEQLIHFLLPLDLRQLFSFYVLAQIVEVLDPLCRQPLHVVAKGVARIERFEQRIGEQSAERLLAEQAAGEGHGRTSGVGWKRREYHKARQGGNLDRGGEREQRGLGFKPGPRVGLVEAEQTIKKIGM